MNISRIEEIFRASLKLGLTSFGGPTAHLGYFRQEYVLKRKWLDERTYVDLIALCQFLPGPASSQIGISIGIIRGGFLGGILAWLGFTLPSVILLTLFAYFMLQADITQAGWIHGLKIAAVVVVAQALLGMSKSLAPDRSRATLLVISTIGILLFPSVWTQLMIIIGSGIFGFFLFTSKEQTKSEIHITIPKRIGVMAWGLFFGLLLLLPFGRPFLSDPLFAIFESFYRVGSLVFGGGHVILPMLEQEVVPTGLVSEATFLTGYGAAQAVPGPLFTFASFLGASISGWIGAIVAAIAIFLPSFLLVIGALPFWNEIRQKPRFTAALMGVNAAVVGILLAALYDPLWTSTIKAPQDFALASVMFLLLAIWRLPPWMIVVLSALGGELLTYI